MQKVHVPLIRAALWSRKLDKSVAGSVIIFEGSVIDGEIFCPPGPHLLPALSNLISVHLANA